MKQRDAHSRRVYGTEHILGRSRSARPQAPPPPPIPVQFWNWKPFDPALAAPIHNRPKFWPNAFQTNYRPGSRRQRVVLLYGLGTLTGGLIGWLKRFGLKYFFFDFPHLVELGTVRIDLDGPMELRCGPAVLDLRDVVAVVGETPIRVRHARRAPGLHARIAADRWMQLLLDLRGLVGPRTLWLPSHPLNGVYEWQNKFSELLLARQAGLAVPATICTNDSATALAFIQQCKGEALFKDASGSETLFRPAVVDGRGGKAAFRHLKTSPCVFQERVDKAFDVRAVVVGEKVFACRIDSQASPTAALDWRVYDDARVRWERMELPRAVERGMLRLMRTLDLRWGSFDFAAGKDGRFYFLEVNRPGACAWLLPYVGIDVTREIAVWLRDNLG